MQNIEVHHYDAFSNRVNMGNPAGVVLHGDSLTDEQMQAIAAKVGFNETVFPLHSEKAYLRLRYFTPGHEINLCGHATVASMFALKTRGLLTDKDSYSVETKAGIITVSVTEVAGELIVKMKQAKPQFLDFNGSKEELLASIGLTIEDWDNRYPIVYGNTGIWTLLIPIKTLDACYKMIPDNKRFPHILTELPSSSVHPFTLETINNIAMMHGRHFSSPYSITIEDSVTGTASGVMGIYYARYIDAEKCDELNLIVEQGQEIGRDGSVIVNVVKQADSYDVYVSGKAVYVNSFEITV